MAAIVTRAQLDVSEGKSPQALAQLDGIVASAATPDMAGAAWLAIGIVHRAAGANDDATRAFTTAAEIVELRLVEPREGPAGGAVSVKMNVRVPAARHIQRVMVSWACT